MHRIVSSLLTLLSVAVLFQACDTQETSLWPPDGSGNDPAPVIESISPDGPYLAGIDEITIHGQNFSTNPNNNIVTLDDGEGNSARAEVLQASATQLRVKLPNLPNPNLRLRISVQGAVDFSNAVDMPLVPAFTEFGDVAQSEQVFGIASDPEGNLFVSMSSEGSSVGIFRFTPNGERSEEPYFPDPDFTWNDLAFASDGELYGTRGGLFAAFRLPEGGPFQVLTVVDQSQGLATIAADPARFVWTAGSNANTPEDGQIFSVDEGGTATGTLFEPTVRDLVVFGDDLYAAVGGAGDSKVMRFPVNADGTLGASAECFNVTAGMGGAAVARALVVTADGTLLVGASDADVDPIFVVAPGCGPAEPLHPGILTGPANSFAWATGSALYVAREIAGDEIKLMRVETGMERGN